MTQDVKYPLGVQSFKSLREDGYFYIDKTAYIRELLKMGKCYFLSRPRRFGKSLFLSTLKAYFQGQGELFKGLSVERGTTEWKDFPVLYLDLNTKNYDSIEALREILGMHISDWEAAYGDEYSDRSISERFARVIRKAYERTKKKVVILVDEYDKPMVMNLENAELQDKMRRELKGFYGVLKSEDEYIHFAMLTGVTKFSKVSVFSDLNNLTDISMLPQFATICGITEEELHTCLDNEVGKLAQTLKTTKAACYELLRRRYDGYHFHPGSHGVYNPFSLLSTLGLRYVKDYWFETGTPTLLTSVLRETDFDLRQLSDGTVANDVLGSVETMHENPLPLMFQSGYLTIKGYDERMDEYRLGFPNEEVERGFVRHLIPSYTPRKDGVYKIANFVRDIDAGDAEAFMRRLQTMTADTDYKIVGDAEKYFHNVMFLLFRFLGFYVDVEHTTSDGRADMVVKTRECVFLFEFKLDKSAAEALRQIDNKGYALAFRDDKRRVVRIGVNFSLKQRRIDDYVIAEGCE